MFSIPDDKIKTWNQGELWLDARKNQLTVRLVKNEGHFLVFLEQVFRLEDTDRLQGLQGSSTSVQGTHQVFQHTKRSKRHTCSQTLVSGKIIWGVQSGEFGVVSGNLCWLWSMSRLEMHKCSGQASDLGAGNPRPCPGLLLIHWMILSHGSFLTWGIHRSLGPCSLWDKSFGRFCKVENHFTNLMAYPLYQI